MTIETMKHLYTLQIVNQVGSMTPNIQVIGSIQGTISGTITCRVGRDWLFCKKTHFFFHDQFLALKTVK